MPITLEKVIGADGPVGFGGAQIQSQPDIGIRKKTRKDPTPYRCEVDPKRKLSVAYGFARNIGDDGDVLEFMPSERSPDSLREIVPFRTGSVSAEGKDPFRHSDFHEIRIIASDSHKGSKLVGGIIERSACRATDNNGPVFDLQLIEWFNKVVNGKL